MILSLTEASAINPSLTQEDLDGFETMLRKETNNKFQLLNTRKSVSGIFLNGTLILDGTQGLFAGDTVEVNYTAFNDGLYTIDEIATDGAPSLKVNIENKQIVEEHALVLATLTKIKYPPDILAGIKKLLEYDMKMGSKLGIKSESVSRVSVTYYDVNATDNWHGYPRALMTFLSAYKRMRF